LRMSVVGKERAKFVRVIRHRNYSSHDSMGVSLLQQHLSRSVRLACISLLSPCEIKCSPQHAPLGLHRSLAPGSDPGLPLQVMGYDVIHVSSKPASFSCLPPSVSTMNLTAVAPYLSKQGVWGPGQRLFSFSQSTHTHSSQSPPVWIGARRVLVHFPPDGTAYNSFRPTTSSLPTSQSSPIPSQISSPLGLPWLVTTTHTVKAFQRVTAWATLCVLKNRTPLPVLTRPRASHW